MSPAAPILDLSPTKVLVLRYQLEERLCSPGSLSGHQAELLRQGLGGAPPDGARPNTAEAERAKLADLVLLCRHLTPREEQACRARYSGSIGVETYKRLRRPCDMRDGDGEEVINARPEGHQDLVEVQGRKASFPSWQEVAERLRMPWATARYLVRSGQAKIAMEQFRKRRQENGRSERRGRDQRARKR